MQDTKLIDTGGGFFIEENENPGNEITDDDMDAAVSEMCILICVQFGCRCKWNCKLVELCPLIKSTFKV